MKKYVFLLLFFVWGCNRAPDGFNAPINAQLTFNPSSVSWQACGGSESLTKVSVRVDTLNSQTQQFEPSQKIYGQVFAQGSTNLYIKAANADILEPVASQLQQVQSDSLSFTTNRQGIYEFVVGTPGVPPGESSEDFVTVDLGTFTSSFGVSATCPQ